MRQIQAIVNEYQDRVIQDYEQLGIMVRFENGHGKIRPALQQKTRAVESEYYYSPADRRRARRWITIKRDDEGLRHDVEMFYQLIDSHATETQMQVFFEENPAFLMEALLGIPISHAPNFRSPLNNKPDFALTPILGPYADQFVRLLELKGPAENILRRGFHSGLSMKVYRAIEQVRDYETYLRDPANFEAIRRALGYLPDKSNLAVLIGREPTDPADAEVWLRRREQVDVKVISYDEILQTQASQIRPVFAYDVQFGRDPGGPEHSIRHLAPVRRRRPSTPTGPPPRSGRK